MLFRLDKIIPEQDNPHQFRELKSVTEYYVPEDQFQQSEDLAGNDNEELMDELMAHKHMFPYQDLLHGSMSRSEAQQMNCSVSTNSDWDKNNNRCDDVSSDVIDMMM